jgi:DNA-binding CsgD family transcriptional regulator
MEEIWRNIELYPDYQVSNLGNVRSLKCNRIRNLKPHLPPSDKYRRVGLRSQNKQHRLRIGELVATSFISPRPQGKILHHKDRCKVNDSASNLQWVNKTEHGFNHRVYPGYRYHLQKSDQPSKRQKEILSLIWEGCEYTEIAKKLGISADTVRDHMKRLYLYAHLKNLVMAIKWALKEGIIDLNANLPTF